MSRQLPPDLGEWIRQTQAGSEEAGEKLFEFCRDNLLSVIKRTLRQEPHMPFDAEDFLDDTYRAILCTHFPEKVLSSPKRLLGYLQKMAENIVRVAARKHCGFRRHYHHETRLAHPEQILSHEPSPEEALSLKEEESRLNDLIAQLPRVDRRIIELWQAGMTAAEIADRLGVPKKHVYDLVRWLKDQLRE